MITEAQAEMILTDLKGSYAWLPTLIAYHTGGLRRGEILALSWDCVDLKEKTLEVRTEVSSMGISA